MKIDRIRLDIDKKLAGVIPSVQWDNNTRYLHINVLNGTEAFNLSGYSVKVAGLKPDGTSFFNDVRVINAREGFIEVVLTEQMNAAAGSVRCELKLYNYQGVLSTQPFIIYVETSVTPKGIVSSNEFKALTDALIKVGSIDTKFETLTSDTVAKATEKEIQKQLAAGQLTQMVIGNNSVGGEKLKDKTIEGTKIKDKTIDKQHVNFLQDYAGNLVLDRRGNLFDKNKITRDGYIANATGTFVTSTNVNTSDFIPCEEGEIYSNTEYRGKGVNFWTGDKKFISGFDSPTSYFTIPKGAQYFRVTVDTPRLDSAMVVRGNTLPSSYVPPKWIPALKLDEGIKVFGANIPNGCIDKEKLNPDIKFGLEDGEVTPNKLSFMGVTMAEGKPKNILTLDGMTMGAYINSNTGEFTHLVGYTATDYIRVIPGAKITRNNTDIIAYIDTAFYDKDKEFISAIYNAAALEFTVPEGCEYIRTSIPNDYVKSTTLMADKYFTHVLTDEVRVDAENIVGFENVEFGVGNLNEDIILKKRQFSTDGPKVNLFDKNKGQSAWISGADGYVNYSEADWLSDFIECIPGETIMKCDNSSNTVNSQDVCFFNKDKVFLSGFTTKPAENWKTFVVPEYAYFFRFDMLASHKDTEEIYAYRMVEVNLFDKDKGVTGYLNTMNGGLVAGAIDWTSDYIECIPGETITKCDNSSSAVNVNGQDVCFFNKDKVFLSGFTTKPAENWKTFVVPEDAYFFRFDMLASHKDTEEIYAYRDIAKYQYTLNDDIKIKKSNILGMEYDESLIVGDTGDIYKVGVDCRGRVYSKFVNTEIPVVELDGNMDGISKDKKVTVDIKYRSKTKNFDGKCTLAWQGNGSVNYPKKNFKIKLTTKEGNKMNVGFRNWVPQDSYHLKANFTDSSHMRNIFMANLMHDVRKEDLPTGGRSTIDGFPVKVKINGKDQGIYTWNLKQSKEVYGLTKENPNHLMYRCEVHSGAGSFANTSNTKAAWEDKFPETSDSLVAAENLAKLNRMIAWVATADDATFKKEINKYLNLNYLIDYWIYSVCFMAGDNLGRNMNLISYDGEVWYLTLYDLDTCAGIQYNGTPLPYDFKMPSQSECPNSVLFKKLRDNFKGEIINRYLELRNTAFATESLLTKIKEYMDFIGLANYNLDKQLWPSINSSAISYNYISENITKRLAMIDNDLTILTDGR